MVTQIGDTNIRIHKADGTAIVLTNDKLLDVENATIRAQTIIHELAAFAVQAGRQPNPMECDAIVANGRNTILSRLKLQYLLQNNTTNPTHGYGILDGTAIPRTYEDGSATDYVRCYQFALGSIATIELVSDGFYGDFPAAPRIADYRQLYQHIHQTDPDKYTIYLSTKSKDDASVVLASVKP